MPTFNLLQSALTPQDIQAVSPALASYTQKSIYEDLCNRPGLSRRDRSIVTVSALIARIQIIGMLHYFNIALDSGVKAAVRNRHSPCVLLRVLECPVCCARIEGHIRARWNRSRPASGRLPRLSASR
jgi:HD-like signal output (HDOD) protein